MNKKFERLVLGEFDYPLRDIISYMKYRARECPIAKNCLDALRHNHFSNEYDMVKCYIEMLVEQNKTYKKAYEDLQRYTVKPIIVTKE